MRIKKTIRLVVLFIGTIVLIAGCSSYQQANISGTVNKEMVLSNYNGEPYMIDIENNKVILYSSLKKEKNFDYIKYEVNMTNGSCKELMKETGTVQYKNYFWTDVAEEDKSPGFCMTVLLAFVGTSHKEYTVQLTKVIDDKNTIRYIFYGKQVTQSSQYYSSTHVESKSGVVIKKGEAHSTMQVTDPIQQNVWLYPLANKVKHPFLSKFYYMDDKNKTFIMSFSDGMVFIGDYDLISVKQRKIPLNKDKSKPYVDLCVDKKGGRYYWLVSQPSKEKKETLSYKIEIRTLDSIIARLIEENSLAAR